MLDTGLVGFGVSLNRGADVSARAREITLDNQVDPSPSPSHSYGPGPSHSPGQALGIALALALAIAIALALALALSLTLTPILSPRLSQTYTPLSYRMPGP